MSRLSHMLRQRRVRKRFEIGVRNNMVRNGIPSSHQSPSSANECAPKPAGANLAPKIEKIDSLETRWPSQPTAGTAAELSRIAEQTANIGPRLQALVNEPGVRKAIERDTAQIPATVNREGYCGDNHLEYWFTGLADLRMVERLAPSAKYSHVLDFGGASGRFARHVPLWYPKAKVTVADLNINHIDWLDRHFGPSIRGVKVSAQPHFPIADNSVTICVGFSVFTHIDTYETAWLAEIHRVLAKKGYAVLTIHSEHVWNALPTWPWIYNVLQTNPEFNAVYRPGEPMPQERLVYKYVSTSNEYNCNVFATSEYIRRVWGRWFDVVAIAPRAS